LTYFSREMVERAVLCVLNFQFNHSAWISRHACLILFLLHELVSVRWRQCIEWRIDIVAKAQDNWKIFVEHVCLKRWIFRATSQRIIRLCCKRKIDSILHDILFCKKLSYSDYPERKGSTFWNLNHFIGNIS